MLQDNVMQLSKLLMTGYQFSSERHTDRIWWLCYAEFD